MRALYESIEIAIKTREKKRQCPGRVPERGDVMLIGPGSEPPTLAAQVAEDFCSYLDSSDSRFDTDVIPIAIEEKRCETDAEKKRCKRVVARIRRMKYEIRECKGCGKKFRVLRGREPGTGSQYHDLKCRRAAKARRYREKRTA